MKLSTDTNNYKTTINKSADFGIEDSDLSHIMGILRSQIYSDKLLAVIREYSTNAVDANTEANNTNPISIILPTIQDPTLSFRDFGNGLSDEEVCNLYVKYGASTKRSSNDYTGCLGIGCKAGFAYGDSFQVISYTKSHISTWLARIDESQRGTISLLHKEPNINKPTGTDVRVSIRKDDIDSCVSKAKEFFKYWKVQPHCNIDLNKLNIVESTDEWAIQSDKTGHHHYARNYGGASLVMGNIRYPIDHNQLNINNEAGLLSQSNSVILYAPLGTVDIAANRESLEYTDRTRNGLVAMTNNMHLDLISRTTKWVSSAPSRIKASISADKYASVLPTQLHKSIVSKCTWQNLPLLATIKFGNKSIKCHERTKSWRSSDNVYRNSSSDATSCGLTKHVKLVTYSDDKIAVSNATRRIRTLQHKSSTANEDKYYVIPRSRLDEVTPQLTTDDYTNLDNVEPLKPTRTASTITNGTTKKSIRINVCEIKPNTLKSSRLSEETEPKAMPDGRYVYVPLDRFDWLDKADALDHLDNIRQALYYLTNTKQGEPNAPIIHGVKKHHVKKLDDQWITLDAYLAELFTAWQLKNQHDADLYAQLTSKTMHSLPDKAMADILQQNDNVDIARFGYVVQLFHKNSRYNYGNTDLTNSDDNINMYNVMMRLQITDRSNYLTDMSEYMDKHYPLIAIMSVHIWADNKDDIAKHIHKYINAVTI
jgi:hypothetical protein